MPDKCLIYCRVSSEKQATDDKTSLDNQEEACRKACEERGYEVIGVYRETFPRSDRNRPLLTELRRRIRAREANVAMAMVIDRLSGDQQDIYVLMDEAENNKARWEFAREVYEKSAIGRFLMSVKSFKSESEIETLSTRVKDRKRTQKQNGEILGALPLGYRRDKDSESGKITIVVDPVAGPTVARIFHLYVDKGLSLREMGPILQEEGHATRGGTFEWHPVTMNRIIENPKYMGRWRGNMWDPVREKGQRVKQVLKPDSEWIWHDGPAIVEPDLWHRANRRREAARGASPRRNRDPEGFLLRDGGHIRCGLCKKPMYTNTPGEKELKAGRTPYYKCGTSRRDGQCKGVYIAAKIIDPAAWSVCLQVLEEPEILLDWMAAQADDGSLDILITQKLAERVELGKAHDKATNRWVLAPESALPKLKEQIEGLDTRINAVMQELEGLQKQAEERERLAELKDTLNTWQADARTRLETLADHEKKAIVRDLGILVTVYPQGHTPPWTLQMNTEALFMGPQALEPDWYDTFEPWDGAGPVTASHSVAKTWNSTIATGGLRREG